MELWREEYFSGSFSQSECKFGSSQASKYAGNKRSDPPWHHIKLKGKGINDRANVVLSTKP